LAPACHTGGHGLKRDFGTGNSPLWKGVN